MTQDFITYWSKTRHFFLMVHSTQKRYRTPLGRFFPSFVRRSSKRFLWEMILCSLLPLSIPQRLILQEPYCSIVSTPPYLSFSASNLLLRIAETKTRFLSFSVFSLYGITDIPLHRFENQRQGRFLYAT